MSSWTVPEFLDSLKSKLEANADLSALTPEVNVYTADPSIDVTSTDVIVLGYDGNDTDEPAALGAGRRDENQLLNCYVQVVRPGAGEAVVKEARDRAATLLREVDQTLRDDPPSVGDVTHAVKVGGREFAQFASEVGSSTTPVRVCVVTFTIEYRARTTIT